MLRHETELDDDSEVKKGAWQLVREHLGDFATKDLDTVPSSGGWLSMIPWGSSTAKKEDPRWEESSEEVGLVMGWSSEDAVKDHQPAAHGTESPKSDSKSGESTSPQDTPLISTDPKATRKLTPLSYSAVAAKPLTFGIEHVSPYPTNADTFIEIDVRLLKGSLTLRRGQHRGLDSNKTIAAITFNGFRPVFRTFTQPLEPNAPPTWEFTSTLTKLLVTDESNPLSRFKKIVQAPRPTGKVDGSAVVIEAEDLGTAVDFDSPELWSNPLLSLNAAQLSSKTGYNMRVEIHLEESLIFYHRQFVEEIVRFFKPPDKHETLNALFDAMMEATKEYANETMDSLRTVEQPMTRSALEFAITETRANLIELNLKAPLIIFPEKYPRSKQC